MGFTDFLDLEFFFLNEKTLGFPPAGSIFFFFIRPVVVGMVIND